MQGVAVTAGSARRRRTLALVVSLLVALVPLLIGGASPAASQGVECTLNPDAPECQSTDGDEDPPSSSSETTLAEEPATTATTESTQVRSEEHTTELQSLMRISYAVFCWTNKHEHPI